MSPKREKEAKRAGVGELAAGFLRLFTRNFWLKALALALAIVIYATLQEEAEVEAENAAAPWTPKAAQPQQEESRQEAVKPVQEAKPPAQEAKKPPAQKAKPAKRPAGAKGRTGGNGARR